MSNNNIPEHRKPLIDYLTCIPDHEVGELYNILDMAYKVILFDNNREQFLFDEFMTTFFIAARANKILR